MAFMILSRGRMSRSVYIYILYAIIWSQILLINVQCSHKTGRPTSNVGELCIYIYYILYANERHVRFYYTKWFRIRYRDDFLFSLSRPLTNTTATDVIDIPDFAPDLIRHYNLYLAGLLELFVFVIRYIYSNKSTSQMINFQNQSLQ